MFFQDCNDVTRCCLWRMKRALFLLIFLLVTFLLVSSIFYVLFVQDHAHLSALKNRFSGGSDGLGPEHFAMVDLQNKLEEGSKKKNSKTMVLIKSSSDDQKEMKSYRNTELMNSFGGDDEILDTNIMYIVGEDSNEKEEEVEAIKLKMISSYHLFKIQMRWG